MPYIRTRRKGKYLYKERETYYETLQECQIKKIQKPFLEYLFEEYGKQYS